MKKYGWLIMAWVFSVFVGLLCVMVGVDPWGMWILTVQEKAYADAITPFIEKVLFPSTIYLGGALLACWFWLAYHLSSRMNRNLRPTAFKRYPGNLKAAIGLLVGLLWLGHVFVVFYRVYIKHLMRFIMIDGIYESHVVAMRITTVVLGGIFWYVMGEAGWGGSFSSWKRSAEEKGSQAVRSIAFGMITTAAIIALIPAVAGFHLWFDGILDGALLGSVSYWWIWRKFLVGISAFGITVVAAYLVQALAPDYKEFNERVGLLKVPVAIVGSGVLAAGIFYLYGLAAWDLGKKNLAEAAGITGNKQMSSILIGIHPDPAKGLIGEYRIPAVYNHNSEGSYSPDSTREDLDKIEAYLAKKPHGRFTVQAASVLKEYYFFHGEIRKAADIIMKYAGRMSPMRYYFQRMIRVMPATNENLAYLKAFSDENTWYHSGDGAFSIGIAYYHFGMAAESDKWLKIAQDRKTSKMSGNWEDFYKNGPMLTTGKVRGRVQVNGRNVKQARVTLVSMNSRMDLKKLSITPGDFTDTFKLVDSRVADDKGAFSFDHLGSGSYLLAVIVPKDSLPASGVKDSGRVSNHPGEIELSAAKPARDLGVIRISADRSIVEKKDGKKQKLE